MLKLIYAPRSVNKMIGRIDVSASMDAKTDLRDICHIALRD